MALFLATARHYELRAPHGCHLMLQPTLQGAKQQMLESRNEIVRCDNSESNSEVAKMTLAFVQRAVLGH